MSPDIVVDGLSYPVVLSMNAAERIGQVTRGASGVAFVYDARVARRAEDTVKAVRKAGTPVLGTSRLRAGEQVKSVDRLRALWDWLLSRGADRSSMLVALGGGTITDLAGFAAATYMRGIRWICVPTTLLGMVDAAIGGKTAIDLRQAKNLVGSFWQPEAVVADVGALSTLPRGEIANGMAEVVKAAVIGDPALLERAQGVVKRRIAPGAWQALVAAAARVKVAIVARDPRESGPREGLNLGHTLGHAIEAATGGRLPHGRAVALGLRGEGLLAVWAGIFEQPDHARVLHALRGAGLALYDRALDAKAAFRLLQADKKRRAGDIRFTLPVRIGEVRTGVTVRDDLVVRALAQCARPPSAEELEV